MHIFVISLQNATERRNAIQRQLSNLHLPFEFIDAFYGKNYISKPEYYNAKKALKTEGRELVAGEVGCALSHNFIYKKIVDMNISCALILEDDVIISNDIPVILKKLESSIIQGQIITLERCDFFYKKTKTYIHNIYFTVKPKLIREGSIAQTAGYIITRDAAEKIQNINFPVFFPADSWGYYIPYVQFRGIIPSQTLIKQNSQYFSSTQKEYIKRQFKKNTQISLLIHGFKTYNPCGKFLYKIYKKILRKK